MTPTLLFDGVCNLCNGTVDFLLRHDRRGALRFAPLQSDAAARLLAPMGLSPRSLDTVILLDNGRAYTRSTAALRTLRLLGLPWSLLAVFLLVPRPLRDIAYHWVSRNRYRWFGTRDTCRLPTPAETSRFL